MGMKSIFEILVQNNRKFWKKTGRSLRSKTPSFKHIPFIVCGAGLDLVRSSTSSQCCSWASSSAFKAAASAHSRMTWYDFSWTCHIAMMIRGLACHYLTLVPSSLNAKGVKFTVKDGPVKISSGCYRGKK